MQTALAFPSSGGIALDGVLIVPEGRPGPFPAVALCHPHPILGGHRDQALIYLTARALEAQGIASLRFNFRGVGDSQGAFSMGKGEAEDARAAVRLLERWTSLDRRRIGLMGYSFGATMAVAAAARAMAVKALALVAPPTNSFPDAHFQKWKGPSLLVAGGNDLIAVSDQVRRLAKEKGPSAQCRIIPGTDHGLLGHEQEVAGLVAEFFAAAFGGR